MRSKLILIMLMIITLSLLFIPFNLVYAQDETASVTVEDQAIGEDNIVIVSEVISPIQAFIAIHQEENGSPGLAIGYTMVESGTSTNVEVEIDAAMVTDTLFAMLHEETEIMGEFGCPDTPMPLTIEEEIDVMAMASFTVTVEEPAAEEPAEELPETGFNFLPFSLIAGILLILGALGVLYIRKPEQE